MSSLRLKRGTEAQRLSVTPLDGELIYTTDTRHFYVGDGTTAGGVLVVGQSGYSGRSGFSGISGFSGANGASGYSGALGVSGYSGQPGLIGLQGPPGISGHSGYSGPSGISGVSGYSGAGFVLTKSSFDAAFDTVIVQDNLRLRVDGVNKRPQIQATSTTFTAMWSGSANITGQVSVQNFVNSGASINASVWTDLYTSSIAVMGDTYTILVQDSNSSKLYRIICCAGTLGASLVIENLI